MPTAWAVSRHKNLGTRDWIDVAVGVVALWRCTRTLCRFILSAAKDRRTARLLGPSENRAEILQLDQIFRRHEGE